MNEFLQQSSFFIFSFKRRYLWGNVIKRRSWYINVKTFSFPTSEVEIIFAQYKNS